MYTKGARVIHYKMEGDQVLPVEELLEWAEWMETADRCVGSTQVGEVDVSTIFLGLGCQLGDGLPLLFETMVFGGKLDRKQWRYSTRDEAVSGHKKVVQMVKAADGP